MNNRIEIFSREILDEYFAVCDRLALRYPEIDISSILMLLAQNSLMVEAQPLPEPVSCDPDDDKFLACALACDTRIIISGDRDLITVSGYKNVKVVTPREFVDDNFT